MNASINSIPFILAKFRQANFRWTYKEELKGELNGGTVSLLPLPLWIIFCIKTLPFMVLTVFLSNDFMLFFQLFSLKFDEFGIALVSGVTAFFALFSVIFAQGVLRFAVGALSLMSYMTITWLCIYNGAYAWAFNAGVGVTLYLVLILYGVWDIVLIVLKKKQMFYIKNYAKSFVFWKKNTKNERKNLFSFSSNGLFLNLYGEEEDEEN